eukprot:1136754-Pelagomonas_calceolata.AAC.4
MMQTSRCRALMCVRLFAWGSIQAMKRINASRQGPLDASREFKGEACGRGLGCIKVPPPRTVPG